MRGAAQQKGRGRGVGSGRQICVNGPWQLGSCLTGGTEVTYFWPPDYPRSRFVSCPISGSGSSLVFLLPQQRWAQPR